MNPMTLIGLLVDGAQILFANSRIISVLSVNIIGMGLWVILGISTNQADREWSKYGIALLSTGVCGFVVVNYAIVVISRIWHSALPILSQSLLILSLLALIAGLLLSIKKKHLSVLVHGFIAPLIIIALIVLVRFAFLKHLEYPLYYDSAVHYQIIQDLQSPSRSQSLNQIWNLNSGRYYHIGFHSIVVVLAAQLRGSFNEAQLILITGHVFLIVLMLNTGLLASKLFNNFYAGILTVIFAGVGWLMPAFAINWGKYPAISSLAIFPLAVYWMIDSRNWSDANRRWHIVLYGTSALCAILLHSRSLVLLGCAAAALVTLGIIWNWLSKNNLAVLFWAEIVVILLIAELHPNLHAALLPYLKRIDLFTTLLALASIVVVASKNLKAATGILTFMVYVAIISTIPTPAFLVRQAGPYLLDRPFLQILLFFPLSLFAGGSFSYFLNELRWRISSPESGRAMVSMGLFTLTVLTVMIRPLSDFKPNPCCVYMRIDDIFIIDWIKENVPKNSRILISTDTDINTQFVKVATDAGAWITPLTQLKTVKFDYRTDFSNAPLHKAMCQENIMYIYVSAVNTSFSITPIEDDKKNFSPIIVLPDAQLYSVNCDVSLPVKIWAMSQNT
jgi:hypothetical protein